MNDFLVLSLTCSMILGKSLLFIAAKQFLLYFDKSLQSQALKEKQNPYHNFDEYLVE